jgi:hypothetical protein
MQSYDKFYIMKTIALLSILFLSFNGTCDTNPNIFKEIERKTKINPDRWLRHETESISVEVSFYIQNKTLRIQHIDCENEELKLSLETALERILLKKNYKEFQLHTLRFKLEREE